MVENSMVSGLGSALDRRDRREQEDRDRQDALEAAWYVRTTAEDVLQEMIIDHVDQLDELFRSDEPVAIGRYVLAIRKALSLRYAKCGDFPDTLRRMA